MTSALLAIDQGTTNSKAVLISTEGGILSRGASPVGIEHPRPGWVEQSPRRVWESVLEAVAACRSAGPEAEIVGVAISNQRELVTVWDATTGEPLGPVVSWQCRRSAPACAALNGAGHAARVSSLTGLPIDPMFPGPKMRWLLDRVPSGRAVRLGTIDSWLIHCLTGGAVHACDASNAARSQLFDLGRQRWSDELGDLFGVPLSCLPEVRDSAGDFGATRGVPGLPDGIPVRAAIGDSHAALFGHGAFRPGDGKVTFGTGSSIMTTLPEFIAPERGITTTIAWRIGGRATYAFEGNILVSAAALPWMVDLLGLPDVQALTDLAATGEPGAAGFVPAFVGLGAPYWQPDARALFSGITFNTTRADMARAVTELDGVPGARCRRVDGRAVAGAARIPLRGWRAQPEPLPHAVRRERPRPRPGPARRARSLRARRRLSGRPLPRRVAGPRRHRRASPCRHDGDARDGRFVSAAGRLARRDRALDSSRRSGYA